MRVSTEKYNLSLVFEIDHPLSLLASEFNARLVVSPNVAIKLLAQNEPKKRQVLAFVTSKGSKTDLVPIRVNDDDYVGIIVEENESEPIVLDDGRKFAVMPLASIERFLTKQKKEVVVFKNVKQIALKLELPTEIQEINQALANVSPKLGELEVRPSYLSPRLYTMHQKSILDNGLTSVAMFKVNKYKELKGGKITKSSPNRHVVGFYIPTKAELSDQKMLVNTIAKLKKKLARQKSKSGTVASFNMGDELDIAVVTPDQLNHWRRGSFFTELVAFREQASSLEAVHKLLQQQLGKEIHIQVQHITNGEADLVFVQEGARLPSDLSAFDIAVEGEGEETKYLERVVGVMCIESGLSDKEKKQMANRVSKSVRLLHTSKSFAGKMPNILAVDKELLSYWQERSRNKESIALPHKGSRTVTPLSMSVEQHEEIGLADVEKVGFYTYEPNAPGIGAKFMQLVINFGDGHEERLTLDQGAQFDNFPWDGISKPSFASGIEAYLPFLPPDQFKFWRRTLELRQAAEQGARFFVPQNAIARDLALRLGLDQFVKIADELGVENAQVEIPEKFGNIDSPNVHHLGVVYTHGHVDHFGWGGLLSTNIPVITADASIPFFETMHLAGGGGFASEAIFRRERDTLLTRKSRRIFTPPLYLPEPYQEIRLGRGQVGVTLLPVSHSIYGGVMVKVVVYDQQDKPIKTIVYTGDFNFDNRSMMDETEKHLHDVDVLITDTTNIRENAYGKPSVGVTREIMEGGFRSALEHTDRSSMVELAWHNIADVHLIQQIAAEMGQSVYVYPKMAILLHLIHQLDETRQKNPQNYNWRVNNPVPRLGSGGVNPWIKPKMTFKLGERMLMQSMDVATHNSLSTAGQHILFVPPNPMLRDTMLGANMTQYGQTIRAHFWPYGPYDKTIVRENVKFARQNRLTYLSDLDLSGGYIRPARSPKYHMSGHARPEDMLALVNRLANNGVLRQVVPIHGDNRKFAAQEIRKQHADLVVYDRFKKQGFTVELYNRN